VDNVVSNQMSKVSGTLRISAPPTIQSCLRSHQPITVLGHCGLRDDAIELSITLDSSGGDFISSELTEKRRRLVEFNDRATRLGLEDEDSQWGIECRTDVIAS
jgi:hypothetical protein